MAHVIGQPDLTEQKTFYKVFEFVWVYNYYTIIC